MLMQRTFAMLLLLAPIALLPRTHAFTTPTPFVRHAPACSGGVLRGQGSPLHCAPLQAGRTRPPLPRLRMAESGGWDDSEVRWDDAPVDATARRGLSLFLSLSQPSHEIQHISQIRPGCWNRLPRLNCKEYQTAP